MERLMDLGKDRTGLGVLCFLVTRAVLIFVDISCVGAYFGIILWMLYLTFLKDCLEILLYAVAKFSTRLKWLYRVFKIKDFLYIEVNELDNTNANEPESNLLRNLEESVCEQLNPCLVTNSLDPASSSIYAGSQNYSQHFSSSQSRNTEVKGGNVSSLIFDSPRSSRFEFQEPPPRKLSSLSTQVVSSTDNFIDETKFEDVDLACDANEVESKTSREDLSITQSPLIWDISKIKFFDQFRKNKLPSPVSVKSRIGNLAAKVTDILPHGTDDSDKLIDKNDSPEQVGCCSYLPHFLRTNYQSSIASYARF